jgi:tetratricopeptide (TPR) repeat protein
MSNRDEQKLAAAEARVKQQTTHSGVDEIRKLLNSLDIRITRLREETPEDALEMLSLFDQVTEKLERTQQLGTPLASEYSQFETILSRFLSQGALFIQKAGGQPVLEAIRQANPPKEERWWWRIDEVIANDRAVRIKRWLRTGLIAAVIIIIAAVIYQLFLAPDPTTRAIYSNSQSAEFNLQMGKYDQALEDVKKALSYSPEDPDLLTLKGVLEEATDQSEAAKVDFETAQTLYTKEENFYTRRGSLYLMTNDGERALADVQTASEKNPDLAYAYLLEGQAYELLGMYSESLDALQIADQVAERTNQPQIQVYARMYMAQILQRPDQIATATPEDGDIQE